MEPNDPNTTAWLTAIRRSTYADARQHLRRDQDVNVRGAGGMTALHVVAEEGHIGKLRKLVKDRADLHVTNNAGETPLMLAQFNVHTEIVAYLIEQHAIVRALVIQLGATPTRHQIHSAQFLKKMQSFRDQVLTRVHTDGATLITAARAGNLSTVRQLVECGQVHIDSVDLETKETPFSAALASGWLFVCDYLLANGAHAYAPCIVSGKKQSSLLTAVLTGSVGFVGRLLAHKCHLSTPQYDKKTCVLMEAATNGSIEMVDVLVHAGMQFSQNMSVFPRRYPEPVYKAFRRCVNQKFWLHVAIACWRQDLRCLQHLFATHKELHDHESLATKGTVALFLAVYQENEAIVTELLARGASITHLFDDDANVMAAAVLVDSVRMLRFLLDRGGDVSTEYTSIRRGYVRRWHGLPESLLTMAMGMGAINCARILIPLETRPRHRGDALKYAVQRNDLDGAGLLLMDSSMLPLTAVAFENYVGTVRTPEMLDLILSRCCANELLSITMLNFLFSSCCREMTADLVAVYLAHGMDVNAHGHDEDSALIAAVRGRTDAARLAVATLLVESGADFVSPNEFDETPASVLATRRLTSQNKSSHEELEDAWRDLFQ